MAPPGGETLEHLDRLTAYFEARRDLGAKERALVGLAHKLTPERAAVGALAAEIEDRAGAPLDADVLDLMAPFLEKPIDDRDTLGRCRVAFRNRLKAKSHN